MSIIPLSASELRLSIEPESLCFSDTSELLSHPLPWIGQERAQVAARFGLSMDQADYNLFVLGEVGSGRSSLLKQAMTDAAVNKPVPPDLCYLHNFEAPERPRALRLPAGEGRLLRQSMTQIIKTLQTEIPVRLNGQEFKTESERIEKKYKSEEAEAYAGLMPLPKRATSPCIANPGIWCLPYWMQRITPLPNMKCSHCPRNGGLKLNRQSRSCASRSAVFWKRPVLWSEP